MILLRTLPALQPAEGCVVSVEDLDIQGAGRLYKNSLGIKGTVMITRGHGLQSLGTTIF